MSVDEIIRLLEVGAKLELKARGEDPASQFRSIQVIVSSAPPEEDDPDSEPPLVVN